MALTASPPSALDVLLVKETVIGSTALNDISNHPGGTTVHHLHAIHVTNTTGSPTDIYIKVYDNKAPVVGTSEPEIVFYVKLNTSSKLLCPDGVPFRNGISACAVKSGGTAGTTTPDTAVIAEFIVRTA